MRNRLERAIAVYQVVCGLWAAFLVVAAAPRFGLTWRGSVLGLILATAAVSSLVAGVQLWRKRPGAYRLSMILQALQVVGLSIPGVVAFGFRLGFAFDVALKGKGALPWPSVHLVLRLGAHDEPFRISVNLLALVVLFVLNSVRPEEIDLPRPAGDASQVASA